MKIIDETKDSFGNAQQQFEGIEVRKPIEYFIVSLAEYLANTNDPTLYNSFKYRRSPDLSIISEDCRVLDIVLSLLLDTDSLSASKQSVDQLENLGKSLVSFLKRRASYLSGSVYSETYPMISLLHDIYTAALYRGKPNILQRLSKMIDKYFADFIYSGLVNSEIETWAANWGIANMAAVQDICKNSSLLDLDPTDPVTLDKLPQSAIDFFLSAEHLLGRVYGGLERETRSSAYSSLIKESRVITFLSRMQHRVVTSQVRKTIANRDTFVRVGRFLNDIPLTQLYAQHGIEVSGRHLLHGREKYIRGYLATLGGHEGRLRRLRELYEAGKPLSKEVLSIDFFNNYLTAFWYERDRRVEEYEEENRYLLDEVLDNGLWFVSPRGDRFSNSRDLELQDKALESISFYTDRRFPREHRVVLRIMTIDYPLEFWLTTDRLFMGWNRLALAADVYSKEALLNLILKRLFFITSGLLSIETKKGVETGEDTLLLEYRRAHYRYLLSTDTRPITMESHGAQVHAIEVLEDYGINIYAEIRRRRALGSLRANEYITYVREVTPGISGQLVLPNEIRYNPELIQIPVY